MAAVYRRGARTPRSRVEVRVGRRGRALRIDGTFASWYAPEAEPVGSVWEAIAAPLLLLPPARRRSVLVLGLGGGSAARIARTLAPGARIVGVELDAGVVRAAERWFDLSRLDVEVVIADAHAFLRRTRRRFDAVLEDVFVGRGRAVHKPPWLPRPGLALAARRLAPGGVLVSNALDEAPAVAGAMRRLMPATLEIGVRDYDNRILVGAPAGATARRLRAAVRAHPWLRGAAAGLSFRTR